MLALFKKKSMKKDIRVILHNIRSGHNVGSVFRTSDACGVSHIYISGYTPSPTDKFSRVNSEIVKTALGAEKSIPWSEVNISNLLEKLKKEGFEVVALEQDSESVDYRKVKLKNKSVLLVGNEVRGLSKSILDKADKIVEIKMKGKKESLNVSVSFAVALFRMIN